jgi:integrase
LDGEAVSIDVEPLQSASTVYRVWRAARESALTAGQRASPLGGRPYDLRHACVSTRLHAGVDSAQVAAWAGHSVAVLMRVYASCLDDRVDAAKRRIEDVIAPQDSI